MVPSNNHFRSSSLTQHIQHFSLEYWINGLNRNTRTRLWHCENIGYSHSKVINKFAQHKTHNFKGYSRPTMFHHFQQGQTGNVNLFSRIILCTLLSSTTSHGAQTTTSTK